MLLIKVERVPHATRTMSWKKSSERRGFEPAERVPPHSSTDVTPHHTTRAPEPIQPIQPHSSTAPRPLPAFRLAVPCLPSRIPRSGKSSSLPTRAPRKQSLPPASANTFTDANTESPETENRGGRHNWSRERKFPLQTITQTDLF